MDNILNCPFCGGPAELKMTHEGYSTVPITIQNSYVVGCPACGIYTKPHTGRITQGNDGIVEISRTGADEAIELWNKRAEAQDA